VQVKKKEDDRLHPNPNSIYMKSHKRRGVVVVVERERGREKCPTMPCIGWEEKKRE